MNIFYSLIYMMSDSSVYLDNNATTPLAEEVLSSITSALKDAWGNPSSSHIAGVKAKNILSTARCNVARMLGAKPSDIIFTSGGTEGNNWILRSAIRKYNEDKARNVNGGDQSLPHFVTSNLEHDSIKCVLEQFVKEGIADVTFVPASTRSGRVEVEDVISAVKPSTCLITVMLANNETGIIQPIQKISQMLKVSNQKVLLHTDAAQAIGKIPVNVDDLAVDYLTVVGHKFYGPRIGAIYVRDPAGRTPLYPFIFGGGQERNFRSGTENTGMIAGLGKACELVSDHIEDYKRSMSEIRNYLETKLKEMFGTNVCFNGKFECSERLPNTCNVSFLKTKLKGYEILDKTSVVQASVGAACHSQNRASHILLAIGVKEDVAWQAVRLSVGRETTKYDIDRALEDIMQVIESSA